ncbi:MAG TPA: class I SAM-dependent methyltransferase [Candidatus Limnocylindrales bacterium]|nr:class I SAM-dependent methyltransferase [Candidatus Limnocylindrales bacterium]
METVATCNLCQSRTIQKLDADFNFCRCRECGYVFDSPRPTIDEIVAFYSQGAKYDSWINAESARDALWRRRLAKLLPHRAPGNLLDVGTGIGQFLHHARPFFTEVQGTEVSESAIRVAKEKYGLEIHHGQVEDMAFAPASYDNITLFHVLEHVPDPVRLIERCRLLLRPNGVLCVAVPNDVLAWTSTAKKIGKKLGLGPFQKFSPVLGISRAGSSREIHLSHFTPPVLRGLLEKAGFEVLEQGIDPYYASSGMRQAVDAVYCGLHQLLFSLFHANRYDTIWMVAKKKGNAA